MSGNGTAAGGTEKADVFPDAVAEGRRRMKRAVYKAQDAYDRAAGSARRIRRQADRLVSDQTYPALAVALAAGLGLGLVLGLAIAARD
ncbi:MAG: hypothetical protein ACRED8_06760 [Caulobacteraceae bacterium]